MRNFFSCKSPYISKEYYDNLKNYKYKSSDASITYKYCMSPLCNFSVQKFPKWLAPNVITVTGFFLNVLYFSITSYYSKLKGGEIPPWACFFSAFCYVTYTISIVTIQSILCSIREKCKKNCTKYLVVSKKAVLLYPEIANTANII